MLNDLRIHETYILIQTKPSSTYQKNRTCRKSSAFISEPKKLFDGLDQTNTPEEYIQHIEACVTFSIVIQSVTEVICLRTSPIAFSKTFCEDDTNFYLSDRHDLYKTKKVFLLRFLQVL